MKKDFTQTLKNFDGSAAMLEKDKPATYATVIVGALLGAQDQATGEEKYNRFKLAQKVEQIDADFTTEDLAKIKKVVGETGNPLLVGRVWDFIEAKDKAVETPNEG